jgi:hypothetical protein
MVALLDLAAEISFAAEISLNLLSSIKTKL